MNQMGTKIKKVLSKIINLPLRVLDWKRDRDNAEYSREPE